jgi:hypothetical protein
MTDSKEQLRRLKNTVMGASHRLSLLARSGELGSDASGDLNQVAAELAAAVRRLERLLAGLPEER